MHLLITQAKKNTPPYERQAIHVPPESMLTATVCDNAHRLILSYYDLIHHTGVIDEQDQNPLPFWAIQQSRLAVRTEYALAQNIKYC